MGDAGFSFQQCFIFVSEFLKGLTSYIFSSNKSVRDARAKQDLSRMQKGKPRDQTM